MASPNDSSLRSTTVLNLSLVLLPVLIFYGVIFSKIVDIPFLDDYDILNFIGHLSQLQGPGTKLMYILTAQHNEYKLILENSIFTAQYSLLGHVSFSGLCVIGDISILLLGIVLWKMFLPNLPDISRRLALFVPVSWLLFQFSYAETLNWAAPAIQNLYILVFSTSTFLLLSRNDRKNLSGAVLCLILAIAASPNGFIAALLGALMLLRARRFLALLPWTLVSVGMLLLYSYHYKMGGPQGAQHGSALGAFAYHLIYIAAFLGAIASAVPHVPGLPASVLLGTALTLFFVLNARRALLFVNPAVTAAVIFIFLTSAGVAGMRSDLGAGQSLSPRYRVYCTLLLILAWFIICEKMPRLRTAPLRRTYFYLASCAIAILLSLVLDRGGYHYLVLRDRSLKDGMALYEHPPFAGATLGPLFEDDQHQFRATSDLNMNVRAVLRRSDALGIYHPPQY